MRGLKPFVVIKTEDNGERRIFYRCVDWNLFLLCAFINHTVASFTDAWIETVFVCHVWKRANSRIFYRCVDWNLLMTRTVTWQEVASFTDAWIETKRAGKEQSMLWSHLLQMRGLKLDRNCWIRQRKSRIFYRCVDWNLRRTIEMGCKSKSHLLQMRGLKPVLLRQHLWKKESHLLQMRGLKQNFDDSRKMVTQVASFTDAWIETLSMWRTKREGLVASFTDAWIETRRDGIFGRISQSHLLQMRGLKLYPRCGTIICTGRIFYRCVDWNE